MGNIILLLKKYWYLVLPLPLLLLWFIYKKFFCKGIILDYTIKGSNLIDSVTAINIAHDLFNAMDENGTDESIIDDCYHKIICYDRGAILDVSNAFGKPKYFLTGSNSWFGSELDLKGWLYKELDSERFKNWQALYTACGL